MVEETNIPDTCEICSTGSNKLDERFVMNPELLISRLSFSHIREIMVLDDPLERFFYELECIKGTWSVRELRRQIDTKLFVRAGISKKPELLLEKIESGGLEAALPSESQRCEKRGDLESASLKPFILQCFQAC